MQAIKLNNSAEPIDISTYDGSGQVVHPSVIDFKNEFDIESWAGFRYWMVITPYPYENDGDENPCLYCSEDGLEWKVPEGVHNPLDSSGGGWDKGFNNDPDMIYNPIEDKLYIYYRFANNKELKVNLIKVNRYMKCEKKIEVMRQSPWNHCTNKNRSLCVWMESFNKWHMWGGGGSDKPPYKIFYFFSEDGIKWSQPIQCTNEKGVDPFESIGMYNWHMSCKPNNKEHRIEFLSYALEKDTFIKKINRKISKNIFRKNKKLKDALLYAQCDMKTPTKLIVPNKKRVLSTSDYGWDNKSLYRSSFQIYDEGDSYFYKIWYTGVSETGEWKLGYTSGRL